MAETKKKTTAAKNSTPKETKGKKTAVTNTSYPTSRIPVRLVLGMVSLVLFCIHLVVVLKPQGTLPLAYKSVILGLFGEVGFWLMLFLLPLTLDCIDAAHSVAVVCPLAMLAAVQEFFMALILHK